MVDLVLPLQVSPVLPSGLPIVCLFEGSLQRTSACSCSHDTFYSRLKLAECDSEAVPVAIMMTTLSHYNGAFSGNE